MSAWQQDERSRQAKSLKRSARRDRARQPFPGDPIRTIDAIHLASLLAERSAVIGLRLLSLDERVRQAAKALGVAVEPA